MEKKTCPPPIMIGGSGGTIRIAYDQVVVEIPQAGPVPQGTPPLAQRLFEAYAHDLSGDAGAE